MDYLGIRCRCKKKDSPLECWSLLGGPALDTLYAHDFDKAPFVDVRFCTECKRMIQITIFNLNEIPIIEALPKEQKLSFKKPEDIFQFLEVHR
jgi:hypothetical protein